MKKTSLIRLLCACVCLAGLSLLTGCGDSGGTSHEGHSHSGAGAHAHGTPHGGTPVIIADHKLHLELVLDASAGEMLAYIFDGHMEQPVAVSENQFVIQAAAGDRRESLTFQRTSESGSGDVPAKSSVFKAKAEWLKSVKEFQGSIAEITLGGQTFKNISFTYPKGSRHVH